MDGDQLPQCLSHLGEEPFFFTIKLAEIPGTKSFNLGRMKG